MNEIILAVFMFFGSPGPVTNPDCDAQFNRDRAAAWEQYRREGISGAQHYRESMRRAYADRAACEAEHQPPPPPPPPPPAYHLTPEEQLRWWRDIMIG